MLYIIILILFALIFVSLIGETNFPERYFYPLIFVLLWLIIGLRYNVGIDYPMYERMYDNPNSPGNFAIEPIWIEYSNLLRWLGFKSRMWFLITSGFTMLCFYKGIKKSSTNFMLSTLIFVLIGFYFETSNAVRQFCAMGCLFWAYSLWDRKHYIYSLVLMIFAPFLHVSAVLGIILIFLSKLKVNRPILILGLIGSVVYGTKIMNSMLSLIGDVAEAIDRYGYGVDDFSDGVSSGALKYVYLIIGIAFVMFQNKLEKLKPGIHQLINLVVGGIILYNIFYIFQPARRLYMYGFMFIILLFPYFLKLFRYNYRLVLLVFTITLFLAFLIRSWIKINYHFDVNII